MTQGETVAIVPVRSLAEGKMRLAAGFTLEAREALNRHLLRGVILAALESGVVDQLVVVSPDAAALDYAIRVSSAIVPLTQEIIKPGLNPAIEAARAWAMDRNAATVVTLFGDLPLLTPGEVRNLIRRDAPVVLAPDRHGTGTNALLLRLRARTAGTNPLFPFQFGPDSYRRHVEQAHEIGLEVATAVMRGTAFDLDTPDDWRALLNTSASSDLELIAAGSSFPQLTQCDDESLGGG
ncbi:MAG: 2-phospho-L-lactate guanylyltransferase [Chloroflexota bacterium]|nr:2-phospho-L-lactate guanylyltransferase [Chloroflexota bacterium]